MTLSKKELQELIDIVKNQKLPEEVDEDPLTKINKFILFFKIKEGKRKVFSHLLHELFQKWSSTKISNRAFGIHFAKFFEPKKTNKRSYYNLNFTANQLIKINKELEDKRDDPNEK